MGSLSVISKGFLGGLLGVSMLAWFAIWRLRSRGRFVVIPGSLVAIAMTLLTGADLVNAHYQYLPRVSDVVGARDWPTISNAQWARANAPVANPVPNPAVNPRVDPQHPAPVTAPATAHAPASHATGASVAAVPRQGAVITVTVPDGGVGFRARSALVYLPPQYFSDPTARFPVVYLLHGSPGMPVDWLRGGGAAHAGYLAAEAGQPQILVMPHLSRDWLDDSECVDGAHMRVETYVVHDLVPAIDAQLRTSARRDDRVVAGMSAGGYCALNLGLRHRDLFGAIVDMSGYTHPTHSGGMPALFGNGSATTELAAANSPDVYVATMAADPPTRLFLLCGTGDRETMRELASLRDRMRQKGFDVTWVTAPGGHTYGVWRPGLVKALRWTTQKSSPDHPAA